MDSMLAGKVCRTCNNTWMSELENAAIPHLRPLMQGRLPPAFLSDRARVIVARWVAKTAYVLNHSSNYLRKVPPEHLGALRAGTFPPERTIVVGGQHEHVPTDGFWWEQSPTWMALMHREHVEYSRDIAELSYKVSFQFGHFLTSVAYWPAPGYRFAVYRGEHVVLQPNSADVSWGIRRGGVESFLLSVSPEHEFHFGLQIVNT